MAKELKLCAFSSISQLNLLLHSFLHAAGDDPNYWLMMTRQAEQAQVTKRVRKLLEALHVNQVRLTVACNPSQVVRLNW
jgi:hypothetical protein